MYTIKSVLNSIDEKRSQKLRNFLFILLVVGLIAFGMTGCERSMTKPVMDAITSPETPTADDPAAFAVALVQAAIDLYKTEGREAMVAYYNDPANVDGQWYVLIADANDLYVAHPLVPDFIGTDIKGIPGIDGSSVGANIAMTTEEGRWTEYLWPNPETNKLEQKRTWSIRYDGYLFGSGYYQAWTPDPATQPMVSKDDPEAFTRVAVLAAIARYELAGLEAIATYYNDPANIDGQWYVFITDENDHFVAHAPRPDFVGTDLKDIMGLDGSPLGVEIAKATEIGLWIEYLWPNPETGENEQKRTWAIRHDGYLFASGYYVPGPEGAESAGDVTTDPTVN